VHDRLLKALTVTLENAAQLVWSESPISYSFHVNRNAFYRDILETTRQALATRYLKEGNHSQAQIAIMISFADQSNFTRAFKRWTGVSPGKYQKAA